MNKFYWYKFPKFELLSKVEIIVDCNLKNPKNIPTIFFYRDRSAFKYSAWRSNKINIRSWFGEPNKMVNRRPAKLYKTMTKHALEKMLFTEFL